MLMDLGSERAASALLTLPDLPAAPATFSERMALEWERYRATGASTAEQRNEYLEYERQREVMRQAGFNAPNPHDTGMGYDSPTDYAMPGGMSQRVARGVARNAARSAYDQQVQQFRQQFPNRAGEVMLSDEVTARARENAVRAYRAAETQDQVGGGALGGFIGAAGAVMTDPVTIATLPLGAGARVTGGAAWNVARTALIEGGIAAAAQVPIEAVAAPYRVSLGLPADVGGNLVEAFAGGAVLGGGVRAIAEAIRLRRGLGGSAGPDGGLRVDDALSVMEDGQRVVDTNPGLPPAVHEARLAGAVDAVAQGRLPVDTPAGLMGGEARVFTPAGRAVAVRYEVAELSSLIPSHTDDLAPNPAFPHAEGVQPRARERDASRRQIDDIAANLEPERLGRSPEAGSGAPIIGPDEVVESGNGRVLALRRVYGDPARAEQQAAYRAWLEQQGFDTAGMQAPVLVARRAEAMSPDQRRAFVQEANSAQAMTMSAAEQARVDRELVGRILPLYQGGDVSLAANADFVRAFMQGLPQTEQGRLMTGRGALSAEGARRIRGAVIARAYGDEMGPLLERILDSDADGMKAIAGALRDSAGQWAAMREAAAGAPARATSGIEPVPTSWVFRANHSEGDANHYIALRGPDGVQHYNAHLSEMAPGILGVAGITNLSRARRGIGAAFYIKAAEYARQRGMRLVVGADATPSARAVHSRLEAAGVAREIQPEEVGATRQEMLDAGPNEDGSARRLLEITAPSDKPPTIAPGMDITPDLLAAVRTVLHARDKGLRVADVVAQMDIDAPPLSDNGRAMLALMHNDPGFQRAAGQSTMTRRLAGYVDEAMKSQPGRDMFGGEAAPARDVLDAVAARETDTDPMRGRQRAAAEAGDRAAEIQAEAKVPDADFLEAQRIAAARDVAVDMGDGRVRGARELLDEAETAANDATNAAACLIGGMAA